MTGAAPKTCLVPSAAATFCWRIALTTPTPCAKPLRRAARGAWANVKPMPHRLNPPAFSKRLYRQRNLVERFFNKLKQFRAVATRYDKRDDNYLAGVKLASIRIWMRFNESVA